MDSAPPRVGRVVFLSGEEVPEGRTEKRIFARGASAVASHIGIDSAHMACEEIVSGEASHPWPGLLRIIVDGGQSTPFRETAFEGNDHGRVSGFLTPAVHATMMACRFHEVQTEFPAMQGPLSAKIALCGFRTNSLVYALGR